jgi:pyrroloquinoline quinone (PQQ) biosynthesis protein C
MDTGDYAELKLLDASWIDAIDRTPFLTRCRAGEVTRPELRKYVIQQSFYSRHFTRYLCALLSNITEDHDRLKLVENLFEEMGFGDGGGVPHSELYRRMMATMGISSAGEPVHPATQALVDAMFECCRDRSPLTGLAALCLGAEAIVPHLYSQVVAGFRALGEPMENLVFFTLHIADDDAHAVTMKEILLRELEQDPALLPRLRQTALRLLDARRRFFEGITA